MLNYDSTDIISLQQKNKQYYSHLKFYRYEKTYSFYSRVDLFNGCNVLVFEPKKLLLEASLNYVVVIKRSLITLNHLQSSNSINL